MEYCEYCQVETPCGRISDAQGEKDLMKYDFNFLGEDLSVYVSIDDGELVFINPDFNRFASLRIYHCPMCGRKLDNSRELIEKAMEEPEDDNG